MLNEKQLRKLVDEPGAVRLLVELSLIVSVTIQDVRTAYGRVDALVTPCAGSGQRWVSAERLSLPRTSVASKH